MIIIKDTGIDYITSDNVIEGTYEEAGSTAISGAFEFIRGCNFYKIFWIFVIGSIFGCYMEQIRYYLLRGIWESRAGVIWGPFSEIYGCGAVLMFLLAQKLKNASPLTVFCVAALCGSSFEYLARLFQEIIWGSISWDYSKNYMNLGGRTSLKYAVYWGLLGLVFINWVFPQLSNLLERMTGRVHYASTWLLIVFMAVNLIFSSLAVGRWNERLEGVKSSGPVEEFLDKNYGNEKMKQIFPHMRFMEPENKIHIKLVQTN